MKTIKAISYFLFLSLSILISTNAFAFNFTQFYFFGDSLTDAGNFPGGSFTNVPGTVWAQFLGAKFGKAIFPSKNGGTDFAFVGATTSTGPFNVNSQVQTAIARNGGRLDPNGLYSIWAGANNILAELFMGNFDIFGITSRAAQAVAGEAVTLHSAGARFILVGNIPNIGDTPGARMFGPQAVAITNLSTALFNNDLRRNLNALPLDIIQVDFNGLLKQILANPNAFGFTNVTDSCDPNTTCQGFLYTLLIHPTVQAHKIIADYVYSVLSAPSFASTLAVLPFGVTTSVNTMLSQQMMPNIINADRRGLHAFVSGNINPDSEVARTRHNYLNDFDTDAYNGSIGLVYFVSPDIEIGAAFSPGSMNTQFSHHIGSINWNTQLYSLFASFMQPRYYINAIVSGGYINYQNIKRKFYFGPRLMIARGSTHAYVFGSNVEGGWFVKNAKTWQTGPFVVLSYDNTRVNQYTEKGTGAGNIAYNSQYNDNFVSGLGWRVRSDRAYNNIHFLTNIFVSVNRQWIGGKRDVRFHVANIVGSHAYLPVNEPKTNFVNAGVNLATKFHDGLIFSVGYVANVGNHSYRDQNINFGLMFPLG